MCFSACCRFQNFVFVVASMSENGAKPGPDYNALAGYMAGVGHCGAVTHLSISAKCLLERVSSETVDATFEVLEHLFSRMPGKPPQSLHGLTKSIF